MRAATSCTLFFLAQLCSGGTFAQDFRNVNQQPYMDREWLSARCRFLVLKPDGAYGHHLVPTLDSCINSAKFGLMHMANGAQDESPFHVSTQVEFVDDSGKRYTCLLESKKQPFDRLPDFKPSDVRSPGDYDSITADLKNLLAENFSVICPSDIS